MSSWFKHLLTPIIILLHFISNQVSCGTNRPIIGVFCHEIDDNPPNCYIAASYVKAVEASGARVVPIFLSRTPEYYTSLADKVNGVLYPGGDALPTTRNGYYDAGKIIFDYALKLNSKGDNFPLLGVCLGLEFLAQYSSPDNSSVLVTCQGMEEIMTPVEFSPGFRNSSLYAGASDEIIDILSQQNVTANYHSFCLRPETKLKYNWRILSTNQDGEGKEFVSSMEIKGSPIAGLQFHPEKNAFEWQKNHPSFEDGLISSRYFYDWLVIEARKNNHSFKDPEEETASLIYNYNPVFSGEHNQSMFTQKYIFDNSTVSGSWTIAKTNWLTLLISMFTVIGIYMN